MGHIQVRALDHVVLIVGDVERSIAWYCDVLGLEPLRLDEWRRGEQPFPSARIDEGTIIDFMSGSRDASQPGNVDHLCFVVDPVDADVLRASGHFARVDGPVPRWGARGDATSLYVRDPDGNLVELRCY